MDIHGWTALMAARRSDHHECVRALIDMQANVALTNNEGKDVLMMVCQSPSLQSRATTQGSALALIVAMIHDQVASLKCACERLQLL